MIANLQQNEATQRDLIREQKHEIARLAGDPASDPEPESEASPKKKKRIGGDDRTGKDALQAGKYFAVANMLWVSPGVLRYLTLLQGDPEDLGGGEEDDDDDGALREEAEQIYRALSAPLRPYVGEGWFRERVSPFPATLVHLLIVLPQFKEGFNSIRSQQAHLLANLFPGYIFPELPAKTFVDKSQRPHLPEVTALLKNKQFLYDRDPSGPKAALDGHLRHPCILQVSCNSADRPIPNLIT